MSTVTANQYGSGRLQRELRFFNLCRWMWFHQAEGKWALVKGETLFGFYDLWSDAVKEGIRRFGISDFLVKKVLMKDEVFWV